PPPSTLCPYTTLFRSNEVDILDQNDVVEILNVLEGLAELGRGVHVVPGEKLFVGADHARRRFFQAVALGVFADKAQQGFNRLFRSEEHTSELQSRENL